MSESYDTKVMLDIDERVRSAVRQAQRPELFHLRVGKELIRQEAEGIIERLDLVIVDKDKRVKNGKCALSRPAANRHPSHTPPRTFLSWSKITTKLAFNAARMKDEYDRRMRATEPALSVADLVLLKLKKNSASQLLFWIRFLTLLRNTHQWHACHRRAR